MKTPFLFLLLTALLCGSVHTFALSGADQGGGRYVFLKPLRGVKRILFLGDSITYAGGYVEMIDAYLMLHDPDHHYELIDAGLPSETLTGLTEPHHAGGAFPRPDLHERLARALALVKPDLVVACYGMNDGIYYPFDAERFRKYTEGVTWLHAQVHHAGARLWLMTPPPFDPLPVRKDTLPAGQAEYPSGRSYEGYDEVLARYAQWLVGQRSAGWNVVDIHTPIDAYLTDRRRSQPDFILAGDGVHLGPIGHRLIARELLHTWGVPPETLPTLDVPESPTDNRDRPLTLILPLVHERQRLLTDAWLTAIGHKRPGMPTGVPLPEAIRTAAEMEAKIRARVPTLPTSLHGEDR